MSVLVWVMGDGEHKDMIATCRASNGNWLTARWNWRDDREMVGYRHNTSSRADALLTEWTEELEARRSVLIAGPVELPITPPPNTTDKTITRWWNDLRPAVLDMVPQNPEEDLIDEEWECTLDLPPAAEEPGYVLTTDPYQEKLSWGPR